MTSILSGYSSWMTTKTTERSGSTCWPIKTSMLRCGGAFYPDAGARLDVILIYYYMPIIFGLETIAKIKELFHQQDEIAPLVVLHTSSEEHEVFNEVRQDEQTFSLLKPIKSQELYTILKGAV